MGLAEPLFSALPLLASAAAALDRVSAAAMPRVEILRIGTPFVGVQPTLFGSARASMKSFLFATGISPAPRRLLVHRREGALPAQLEGRMIGRDATARGQQRAADRARGAGRW